MSNTASTAPANFPEMVAAKGRELRDKHGRTAAVVVERGAAFFRQPSADAFDEWRSMSGTDAERKAFRAYVAGCYVGCLEHDGTWLGPESLPEVAGREGPGWITGPAGAAVNVIAGSHAREKSSFF